MKASLLKKLQRALARAKVLGKGMNTINKRAAAQPDDEAHGRMVIDILTSEAKTRSADEVFAIQELHLVKLWQADTSTKTLSLEEWKQYRAMAWKLEQNARGFLGKNYIEFIPWLYEKVYQNSDKREDKLTWLLRMNHQYFQMSGDFEEKKEKIVQEILEHSQLPPGSNDTEKLNHFFEASTSGVEVMYDPYHLEFKKWKQEKNNQSFAEWILKKEWVYYPGPESFDDYKVKVRQDLMLRWEKSGMKRSGVSFEDWRKLQDPTLLNDKRTRAFIHCQAAERALLRIQADPSGTLTRNDVPYDTAYETTAHSGKGYAIFVIGPDEEIYAASHIRQVFHHSSFFSSGAVLAGGEVRMGLDAQFHKIVTDADMQKILTDISQKTPDPYKIHFIYHTKERTWSIAAQDETGHIKRMSVPLGSTLAQVLRTVNEETMTFQERETLLALAADTLGKPNPAHQVTLLSNKSGHYQPSDEENYYMLKAWEKKGVDLRKTVFIMLRSSATFSSAQAYLDKIEPLMRARKKARLYIEAGAVQDNQHQPLSVTEITMIINKRGECYLGDLNHPAFHHASAKVEPTAAVGKQEIRGGGTITLNTSGDIKTLDSRLGSYILSDQEIVTTCLALKRKGVNLSQVTLITYDEVSGQALPVKSAQQYLLDRQKKQSVNTEAATMHEKEALAHMKAQDHPPEPQAPADPKPAPGGV